MEDPTLEIPNLPNELIIEILTRLPVKPLLKFKCVCKPWRALISSPQFVKSHLENSKSDPNSTYSILTVEAPGNLKRCSVHSLLYDSVSEASDLSFQFQPKKYLYPVSSCNGLVLLYMDDGKELYLWNPSTRTCKILPGLCLENDTTRFGPYGLGYDKSSDDYKVVVFSRDGDVMVKVYSVRNDRSKRISNLNGLRLKRAIGRFANGKVYWIAYRDHEYETGPVWYILSLDMEKEEEYEMLQIPSYVKTSQWSKLQVCEGSLYLICTHETCTDVWIADGCGVGIEKWTKVVSIPCIDRRRWAYSPILLLDVGKSGLVLFLYDSRIVVYDSKDCSFRYPEVRNLGDNAMQTYVESLVSPLG